MPDPAPSSAHIRALRRLALVVGTTALAAVGLAIIAAVCWQLVPPVAHDAAFVARYAVLDGFFYPRQPAKSLAFQAGTLAAPLLIALAMLLCRRIVPRLDAILLRRWIAAGLALDLLLFAACLHPLLYDPHPPLWMPPAWLLCPLPFPPSVPTWEWIASLLAGLGLVFWLRVDRSGPRLRRGVIGLIFALALVLAPVEFYAPSQITDQFDFTYHLNAMLDALSQSINGHHLLVDFPHIYGGYGEIMAPVLRLFPRTMAVPLIALALPTLAAIFCWLLLAHRLIRRPGLLALAGCGLLAVGYLMALPPAYIYGTPRSFFPALGLLLAAHYFRRPSRGLGGVISVAAAVASIWNLDTGLVLWLAWTLTLLAGEAARRDGPGLLKQLAVQVTVLAAVWALFIIDLRLVSHQWPDLRLLVYFQALVVEAGYFCVAMVVPSAWLFLLLLYLTGLVVAAHAHGRRRVGWKARMILLLSLTGIGMFSYYTGRSAESNLISVCPPGILLAALLADAAHARLRHGLLPPITRWFLAPWLAMIFWWAFLFFVHLPVLLAREARLAQAVLHPAVTPLQANAALAATWVRPGENDVYFLSGHSGFYYYLTGTTRPLRIPGNVELLEMRDIDALLDAIGHRRLAKLIVDRNFFDIYMYRPDVYQRLTDAIARNYQAAAVSGDGRITLDVPRPTPAPP